MLRVSNFPCYKRFITRGNLLYVDLSTLKYIHLLFGFQLLIIFSRPKRFTLKAYKRYWFTCRDLTLRLYKNRDECDSNLSPVYDINLRGCEVTPDVCLTQQKYGIKLEVPTSDGMSDMYIRCETVSSNVLFLTNNYKYIIQRRFLTNNLRGGCESWFFVK